MMLLTGNHAASYAVKLCRVQVIAAYPITPQTTVMEKVADLISAGEMNCRMIKVESEHSSMAACIGASATGARVFTATSSHGLAFMHEMLHWAAGSRLPIVLLNTNRSIAAPWNLGVDQLDSLAQRDTGWLQFYCENNQEVLDTVIQAYKIAETVSLPTMVCLDGFYLSHTTDMVDIPDIEIVDKYLPPRKPLFKLDPDNPAGFGGTTTGEEYTNFRYCSYEATLQAPQVISEALDEFGRIFGRKYGLIESDFSSDDPPEIAVIAMGAMVGTIRHAIALEREAGRKVGLIKIRSFRPFPAELLNEKLKGVKKVAVIDRDISLGSGGVVCQEVKAALYSHFSGNYQPVFGFIVGIGGSDVTIDQVRGMIDYADRHNIAEANPQWIEVAK